MNTQKNIWADCVKYFSESSEDEFLRENSVTDMEECFREGQKLHLTEFLDELIRNQEKFLEDYSYEFLSTIRKQRLRTWNRNQRFNELINKIENASSLDFLWLKGALYLKNNFYSSGIRRMSDLDMLIRKEDIRKWTRCFESLGFDAHRSPDWILSEHFDDSVSSTVFTHRKQEFETQIDVHWHLVDFPARRSVRKWNFSINPIWDEAGEKSLSNEHQLLYQADHAFSHSFRRWKWFIDLEKLINSRKIDKRFLSEEAERCGFRESLLLTDLCYKKITGNNLLPKRIRKEVNGVGHPSYSINLANRASSSLSEVGDYLKICVGLLENTKQKFYFLYRILWPPPAAIPDLPKKPDTLASFIIYFKRTWKVLWEGIKIMARV